MPRHSGSVVSTDSSDDGVEGRDGCTALWAAVISTALADATMAAGTLSARPIDTEEARAFLSDRTGRWARARVAVADAAGIDPEALRQRATRIIAGEQPLIGIGHQGKRWSAEALARQAGGQRRGGETNARRAALARA